MKFTLSFEVGTGTGIDNLTSLRYALQGIAGAFYGYETLVPGPVAALDGLRSDVTATLGPVADDWPSVHGIIADELADVFPWVLDADEPAEGADTIDAIRRMYDAELKRAGRTQ